MSELANMTRDSRASRLADGELAHAEPVLPSAGSSIRALLRDTALLVTSLAQDGKREPVEALRDDCVKQVREFAAALEQHRVPVDVQQDALLAQCGLLDETVLRQLSDSERARWEARPLQVEHFGRHDAGTYVFERIAARQREPQPNADLLEAYAAILGLGFTGRYAARRGLPSDAHVGENANDTLERVTSELAARLQRLGRGNHRAFVTEHGKRRIADWFYRLSPWAIAALGVVVAAIVFAVWNGLLAVQLSRLIAAKS
jgi:type VI secretion system protein ImpK